MVQGVAEQTHLTSRDGTLLAPPYTGPLHPNRPTRPGSRYQSTLSALFSSLTSERTSFVQRDVVRAWERGAVKPLGARSRGATPGGVRRDSRHGARHSNTGIDAATPSRKTISGDMFKLGKEKEATVLTYDFFDVFRYPSRLVHEPCRCLLSLAITSRVTSAV